MKFPLEEESQKINLNLLISPVAGMSYVVFRQCLYYILHYNLGGGLAGSYI